MRIARHSLGQLEERCVFARIESRLSRRTGFDRLAAALVRWIYFVAKSTADFSIVIRVSRRERV
jgi:hypothetical protein